MEVTVNRDALLKTLGRAYGIIEKKSTLPILSNVLIEADNSKIKITATDLDIIYVEEISSVEIKKSGSTTTSANILYEILRKLQVGSKITLTLQDLNRLKLETGKSRFNLLCIAPDNFPLSNEDFKEKIIKIKPKKLLQLLNKTKISVSNDETRHYLNGIYLHKIIIKEKTYLTGVATDSHRLSLSSIEIDANSDFESIILPKKTIFQLTSLLEESSQDIQISNNKSKIKFEIENGVLISKVIDGKFPDYRRVIPQNNEKKLKTKLTEFKSSIDRVVSVSSDKKDGVKMALSKDNLKLMVNSPNSGEGSEIINAEFNSEQMSISFNSKYLIDIASQIENEYIILNLKDPGSPVLIQDMSDKDSLYVVMPMKI